MLGVQPSNITHAPCCVWGHISTITLEGIQETAYPTILTKMYFYKCLFWYGSRSGETRCTHFVALYPCALCASPGYTRYFDRTSVYLCASPRQNLAVPQDFYSPLSISMERSGWPRIRWCGIGGFQEQAQCLFVGLVALFFFVFNYFPFPFFSSIGWWCMAGVFWLI